MVRLQRDELVLELAPDVGGSVSAFYSQRRGQPPVHWLRPAETGSLLHIDPLGMASFPLLPWCNRLRGGRAHACGHDITLPEGPHPHALHGLGWQASWRVRGASEVWAQMDWCHEAGTSGWPWSFSASQVFELLDDGLRCRMTLLNDSAGPMPCGLGHHPFFAHLPGTRLQCRVQAMWETDGERLPTRLLRPAFLEELAQGLVLARLDLDNNFIGWDRRFVVSWPGRSHRAVLSAEPPLDFFVLYCPQGCDHFCAEPVSNCSDWLNLAGHPAPEVGGSVLAPGQALQASWSLRLEPA